VIGANEKMSDGEEEVGRGSSSSSWTFRRGATIGLILVILGAVIFTGTRSRSDTASGPSALESCSDLRSAEVARSERLLRANLSGTITAAVSELTDVQSVRSVKDAERTVKQAELETNEDELKAASEKRTRKQTELTDMEGDLEEARSDLADTNDELRAAEEANEDQARIDSLTSDIADLTSKIERLGVTISTRNEQIAALSEEIGSLTEAISTLDAEITTLSADIDALVRRETALETTIEAKYLARSAMLTVDDRTSETRQARTALVEKNEELGTVREAGGDRQRVDALSADIELLELRIVSLNDPIWSLETESDDDISGAYLPPRSDVNLVPAVPVSHINLGSHRATSKVEIVLASASFGAADNASTTAEDGVAAVTPNVELPDKAEYFTEVGQFGRSEGRAIPTEQISVWARRVGTLVIMSVCIEPDGLHPGMYAGDVYLVDPSLNPTRVRVEVTAQSRWINGLYLLLFILPGLALAYVWITARYSAGQDPWKKSHWWAWFRQNSVAVLVVGFAAVWATLQVPFNNPTWGTSWLTSAAVIGVGLVAAVTAMTVVAGRVVAERQPDDPPGDQVAAETGEDTQDDV
jgi:predicted  nucleic acid-binding Zn-ribbon protein